MSLEHSLTRPLFLLIIMKDIHYFYFIFYFQTLFSRFVHGISMLNQLLLGFFAFPPYVRNWIALPTKEKNATSTNFLIHFLCDILGFVSQVATTNLHAIFPLTFFLLKFLWQFRNRKVKFPQLCYYTNESGKVQIVLAVQIREVVSANEIPAYMGPSFFCLFI